MAVRSKQLAIGEVATTESGTLYSVPTGYRTIIKGISCLNLNSAFNRMQIDIVSSGGTLASLAVSMGALGTIDESKHLQPWIVLEAGMGFKVVAHLASVDYVFSGAELKL